MITRKKLIAASAVLSLLLAGSVMAQSVQDQGGKQVDYLFVQTAKTLAFDKSANKLTLEGISPISIFFSDRPERITGHMKTTSFIPFWSKGTDSFLKDPPNADVSIVEGDQVRQVVVVLQQPELKGDSLSYTIKVLEGEMPAKGADVSVFIDVIGMPRTPYSYAGAARRAYWR